MSVQNAAPPSAPARPSTEQQVRATDISLVQALEAMLAAGASDLHLTAGAPPTVRIAGDLKPLAGAPRMDSPALQRVLYAMLTQQQREFFEERLELDFSYALPGRARFRVNMYKQRESVGAAFRVIPFDIKSLESLGIPPVVGTFASLPRGFVLVTGPTGSGKSTTLASLIDIANTQRHDHIMTVEDPIEFLHRHRSCLVNQREVGTDTHSFGEALKHVLRQDPDIILVGEMRDRATIDIALKAAETGHLVFSTVHTVDAARTINRLVSVFDAAEQDGVRLRLAESLRAVISQRLLPRADGQGRVVAVEVMRNTATIAECIAVADKTGEIRDHVADGRTQYGMQTFDQHLMELFQREQITLDVAKGAATSPADFERNLQFQ